jgi:hypothetical protein
MTNEAELSMPNEVLLVERLRSIPVDAHLSVHTPNPLGHDTRHWAVGALCHDAAARLDALRAELEAERAKLVPSACCQEFELCRGKCVPLTEHWRERAEKAGHELDAARADAERYRWLRNDSLMYLVSGPICVAADKWGTPIKTHPEDNPSLGPALPVTLDGKELDAAIDAARKEK